MHYTKMHCSAKATKLEFNNFITKTLKNYNDYKLNENSKCFLFVIAFNQEHKIKTNCDIHGTIYRFLLHNIARYLH